MGRIFSGSHTSFDIRRAFDKRDNNPLRSRIKRRPDQTRIGCERPHKGGKLRGARGDETVYEIALSAESVLPVDEHGIVTGRPHLLDNIGNATGNPCHQKRRVLFKRVTEWVLGHRVRRLFLRAP
jgi:hypothetical protein